MRQPVDAIANSSGVTEKLSHSTPLGSKSEHLETFSTLTVVLAALVGGSIGNVFHRRSARRPLPFRTEEKKRMSAKPAKGIDRDQLLRDTLTNPPKPVNIPTEDFFEDARRKSATQFKKEFEGQVSRNSGCKLTAPRTRRLA